MKFTVDWLKKHINCAEYKTDVIYEALNSIGLEVEEIFDKAEELKQFKVVQVVDVNKHPDADKLNICMVDTGSDTLQIVCGAPNVKNGMKAVLAPVGSIIPLNNMKIKKSKIRGVESQGMLCSANELCLGSESDGIINIIDDRNIGEVYYQGSPVFDISVTPNRGDCLSVQGIARDLYAYGLGELKDDEHKIIESNLDSPIKVDIEDGSASNLFMGIYITGIDNHADVPAYIADRLNQIGISSKSPVVDIINYVMFDLGNPMHVYDAQYLNSSLVVKKGCVDLEFVALNNIKYKIDESMIVIADNSSVKAIAGIIGSLDSACTSDTKDIFLEAACFNAVDVALASRKLSLVTDASYRFERGVDRDNLEVSLNMAAALITEVCGGKISCLESSGDKTQQLKEILFRTSIITDVAGYALQDEEVVSIFNKLGFKCKYISVGVINVVVPSRRSDISIPEDLLEEVIRIYGYDKIEPKQLPCLNTKIEEDLLNYATDVSRGILVNQSMIELITWSFVSEEESKIFSKDINQDMELLNPINSELNIMRPSILPHLCKAVVSNMNRGIANIAIFEVGCTYHGIDDTRNAAVGVRVGRNVAINVHNDSREVDIFDVKADCMEVLAALGVNIHRVNISTDNLPEYLHPCRSGGIYLGKNLIAYFGELHIKVNKFYDIKPRINIFEVRLDNIPVTNKSAKVKVISNYQSVYRDFAFVVDNDTKIGDIIKSISGCDNQLIRDVTVVDIYSGKELGENKISVACRLLMQADDRTLTDNDLIELSNKIINSMKSKFSAVVRDENFSGG